MGESLPGQRRSRAVPARSRALGGAGLVYFAFDLLEGSGTWATFVPSCFHVPERLGAEIDIDAGVRVCDTPFFWLPMTFLMVARRQMTKGAPALAMHGGLTGSVAAEYAGLARN